MPSLLDCFADLRSHWLWRCREGWGPVNYVRKLAPNADNLRCSLDQCILGVAVPYSRKILSAVVSAAVAMLCFTSFATVMIIRSRIGEGGVEILGTIWPITLTCAVAVTLVMSALYRTLLHLFTELQEREAVAKHVALHDQLTGLPNRVLLQDRLEQALTRYRRTGEKMALLVLDLDRFKQVNDTLGHQAGDELVCLVGKRLQSLLRETDTVARLGGDEFAIVMTNIYSRIAVQHLCRRIVDAISEPFQINGREARVGVSIGAILADQHDGNASDLIRKADITMYKAKRSGRGFYRLYSEDLEAAVRRRDQIEMDLRAALASGTGLLVHYQPQIASNGSVAGFECLLRWTHPVLGNITPGEVVPIAEECGLIAPIGEFVLREACKAARAWPELSFAVNLSPVQFRAPNLPARLSAIAAEEGVPCEQIELEITENLLLENGDGCEAAIQKLRGHGFRVALDDFGTGYSSLAYLRQFPIDKIKLDRSFIDVAHQEDSIAIIRAAVHLGQALKLEVVAEGVSAKEHEQVALEAGCNGLQGFLYAPALPLADVQDYILQRRRSLAA